MFNPPRPPHPPSFIVPVLSSLPLVPPRRHRARRRANALPKAPELCLSTKSKLRLRGDVRRFVRIRWPPLGESIPLFRLPRLTESILRGRNLLLHRRQGPTEIYDSLFSCARTFEEPEKIARREEIEIDFS